MEGRDPETHEEEGPPIDPSLSALGKVVKALADNPFGHIPYYGSKLTQALQVLPSRALSLA